MTTILLGNNKGFPGGGMSAPSRRRRNCMIMNIDTLDAFTPAQLFTGLGAMLRENVAGYKPWNAGIRIRIIAANPFRTIFRCRH